MTREILLISVAESCCGMGHGNIISVMLPQVKFHRKGLKRLHL